MEIDLFIGFFKKKNSTARPTEGGTVVKHTYTGHIKEPSSTMRPVIEFQNFITPSVPVVYTYAYIPNFARYYFVEDWTWNNGLWQCTMTVDVLATYKTHIGETTQYVLRHDSDSDFNGAICDAMYPVTTDFSFERTVFSNPFVQYSDGGTYILGIISNESQNATGAITYYAMTQSELNAMCGYVLGIDNLEEMGIAEDVGGTVVTKIADMSYELFRTLYNPFQYIASCTWFPIDIDDLTGDPVGVIHFGWWVYTLSATILQQTIAHFEDRDSGSLVQIPSHPQATGNDARGEYLNYAPYTRMTLHGKFGTLPLDPSYFKEGDYIIPMYEVDLITGQCLYEIYVADNSAGTDRTLVTKTNFLLGTPIQLAQIGVDYLGAASTISSGVGSIVTGAMMGSMAGGVGGAITGAISNGVSAIHNVAESLMPQLMTDGANGSFVSSTLTTELIAQFMKITDEDIEHKGRPLCELRRIDTLSGYILCADGDIDLNCYDNERQMVKDFLTTGFFWE